MSDMTKITFEMIKGIQNVDGQSSDDTKGSSEKVKKLDFVSCHYSLILKSSTARCSVSLELMRFCTMKFLVSIVVYNFSSADNHLFAREML